MDWRKIREWRVGVRFFYKEKNTFTDKGDDVSGWQM
jgi:hypothetical protein